MIDGSHPEMDSIAVNLSCGEVERKAVAEESQTVPRACQGVKMHTSMKYICGRIIKSHKFFGIHAFFANLVEKRQPIHMLLSNSYVGDAKQACTPLGGTRTVRESFKGSRK